MKNSLHYNPKQHETVDHSLVTGNFGWTDEKEADAQNLKAAWAEALGLTEKQHAQMRSGVLEKIRRHGLESYYPQFLLAEIAAGKRLNFLEWAKTNGFVQVKGRWAQA